MLKRFILLTMFGFGCVWLVACDGIFRSCLPREPISISADQPRQIVIDTDMAPDDWMAILYLLQRPDVHVEAITVTGTGEAHCEPGIRHALGLIALAGGDDIPVACGRETPLQGDHAFPTGVRDYVDNLFGLTLPESTSTPSGQTAVELLASVIGSSPEKITLLTLGPLTNVAEVLQGTPSLVGDIEMLYIMGGAIDVPGNIRGLVPESDNEVAEWNIYVDPHAASIVFDSGVPITLVPLDATNHVPVTSSFFKCAQKNHSTPEAGFVVELLAANSQSIESGGYYFWDPLAAAIMSDESLATFQTREIRVVEGEGPESGYTKPADGVSSIRVAVSADGSRFEQLFLAVLNGLVSGASAEP